MVRKKAAPKVAVLWIPRRLPSASRSFSNSQHTNQSSNYQSQARKEFPENRSLGIRLLFDVVVHGTVTDLPAHSFKWGSYAVAVCSWHPAFHNGGTNHSRNRLKT
jgi:hypothetical protein